MEVVMRVVSCVPVLFTVFEWMFPAAASVTPDHFPILPPAQLLTGHPHSHQPRSRSENDRCFRMPCLKLLKLARRQAIVNDLPAVWTR